MLYTLVHALGTRSGCAYILHVTAKSGEAIALPAAPLPTALVCLQAYLISTYTRARYILEREEENSQNRYTLSVLNSSDLVGHVLQELSL